MRYLLLILPLLLLACEQKSEKPPVTQETMERLVMDLHMAEVYSSIHKDSIYTVSIKNMDSLAAYQKDILHHYNITQEQFADIISWYKVNPQELDSIYAKVIPLMSELETKYSAENK